jgi:hypothetical protein
MNSKSRVRHGLAIAALVSALATPAASAAPVEQSMPGTHGEAGAPVDYSKNSATGTYAPATEAPVRVVQAGADNGFDWGDAGIGAGGLLALAAIASGAVVAIRHRPDPRHKVA